jgi:NTE family protein
MNKSSVFALISLLLIIIAKPVYAQSQRPKIGLVLSGGGAKGIAHVRVLQVLDSLGIVPDYIAGTSMGSVVGALYASGYSAHQIDSITQAIHWTSLFSNSVSFDEINIEEKDEFGRYIYELPLNGLKPQLPLGMVVGQNIEELLASLFFPVNTITNFDKLPTPFLCVAADIVKGEPVVLRKGSLATAVRASMSIPTVFTPVRMEGRLLVDGGVYVNLPVEYCRQMGADFIIAVDVGGGLMREDELTSAAQLLIQTTFLASNISYEKERANSDIFVDVFSHLKYGTMDFEEGPSMMQSGDTAVRAVMPQLVELANLQKKYPIRQRQPVSQRPLRYSLEKIGTEGISKLNQDLALEKFGWRTGDRVTNSQISTSVHKLLGTRLFDKVSYTIDGDTASSVLTLRATEKPTNAVKFAIHYDTDRGAGLILNFTKRNWLLRSSRLLGTFDLAENPKGKINYFYYTGNKSRWWHHTEVYAERLLMNAYIEGTPIPNILNRYLGISTQLNQTINQESFWGFGLLWQNTQLKPKVDPRTESSPDPIEIIEYNFQNLGAKLQYQINTTDRVFFPTRGKWINIEAKTNFSNPFDAQLYFTSTDTTYNSTQDGLVQSYLRFNLKAQRNIPIQKRFVLQILGQVGITQEMIVSENKYSAYTAGAGDFISVGGQLQRPRPNSFIFMGLKDGELAVPQVLIGGVQLQTEITKNIYVTPTLNLLVAGYDAKDFWSTLIDFNFSEDVNDSAFYQFGMGLTGSYMSLLGPIHISISKDLQIDKVRGFLSIGFNL